jgi:hypothetical protein
MRHLKLLNNLVFIQQSPNVKNAYVIRTCTRFNSKTTNTVDGDILSSTTKQEQSKAQALTGLFRCSVDDPVTTHFIYWYFLASFFLNSFSLQLKHDSQHIGKFYKLPDDDIKRLDPSSRLFRNQFVEQVNFYS